MTWAKLGAEVGVACAAGVVGQPNVGKSSLINSLKRARVAQTGNTPGVTKAVQQVGTRVHQPSPARVQCPNHLPYRSWNAWR